MPIGFRLDDATRSKIIAALRDGTPIAAIAARYGLSKGGVAKIGRAAGIPPGKRWAGRYGSGSIRRMAWIR